MRSHHPSMSLVGVLLVLFLTLASGQSSSSSGSAIAAKGIPTSSVTVATKPLASTVPLAADLPTHAASSLATAAFTDTSSTPAAASTALKPTTSALVAATAVKAAPAASDKVATITSTTAAALHTSDALPTSAAPANSTDATTAFNTTAAPLAVAPRVARGPPAVGARTTTAMPPLATTTAMPPPATTTATAPTLPVTTTTSVSTDAGGTITSGASTDPTQHAVSTASLPPSNAVATYTAPTTNATSGAPASSTMMSAPTTAAPPSMTSTTITVRLSGSQWAAALSQAERDVAGAVTRDIAESFHVTTSQVSVASLTVGSLVVVAEVQLPLTSASPAAAATNLSFVNTANLYMVRGFAESANDTVAVVSFTHERPQVALTDSNVRCEELCIVVVVVVCCVLAAAAVAVLAVWCLASQPTKCCCCCAVWLRNRELEQRRKLEQEQLDDLDGVGDDDELNTSTHAVADSEPNQCAAAEPADEPPPRATPATVIIHVESPKSALKSAPKADETEAGGEVLHPRVRFAFGENDDHVPQEREEEV